MSNTEQQAAKPPTQGIGVEGIAPKPIELKPAQELRVSWQMVGALPAFQMFVNEQAPCPAGRDQQQWATEYAVRYAAQQGDEGLFDEYAQWHQDKGCWPNETPLGQIKE